MAGTTTVSRIPTAINRIANRFTTLLSFRGVTAPVNQVRAAWFTGEAAFLLAIDSPLPSLLGIIHGIRILA
jgi:hypothetical protein